MATSRVAEKLFENLKRNLRNLNCDAKPPEEATNLMQEKVTAEIILKFYHVMREISASQDLLLSFPVG